MYELSRYLSVRRAYGASFSTDGTLSFLLDTTGVPQVWTVTAPNAWPTQQTFADEAISFASWSPESQSLIFGMDEGGNERTQLYHLDTVSGVRKNLTETPDAIHRWGGWAHNSESFAFTANRRETSVFDVYIGNCDTDSGLTAECIHEGDGWLTVSEWAPSDDRVLISQTHWSFDQDLFEIDIDTGEIRHLTPHVDDVRFNRATWAPSDDAIYVITDYRADTLYLARLDVTGSGDITDIDSRITCVADGGSWNIDDVVIDHETGRIVYSRNVDGYTELTVGELTETAEINTFPTPDIPGSIAGGITFDDSAERFAVTATGRSENPNIHVVDINSGATTQWTNASTAGIPQRNFITPELVRYPTFDNREIPGLLSVPDTWEANQTPVIVDIHGGPESQRRPSFRGLTQYFLNHGYAIFEPNIRGSTGYGRAYTHLDDTENRMDAIADIEAAADWLAGHDAIDPDRIAAMGGSYGGFAVLAALAETPHKWAAGIDIVGIANFITFLENTGSWRRELREAEYGSLADDRAFLESISPTTNADSIETPLFVLHGANDPRVPVGEAKQIAEAVREQDVPVSIRVFDDEGHGITKRENRIDAYTDIVEFLDEHV